MENWIEEAWDFIIIKTSINNKKIGANFLSAGKDKKYILEREQWRRSGFWPGILWIVYIATSNEDLRRTAEECEEKMEHLLRDSETVNYNLGVMWTLTNVANYKLTGNKISRRRALLATSILTDCLNSNEGYIGDWNHWCECEYNSGIVTIDSIMHLPLLYWATEESKDQKFKGVAKRYAENILEHFINEDGFCYYMVEFNNKTGEVVDKKCRQGFSDESPWSWGCAWAIYGFVFSYKYTKDIKFLNGAKKVANYLISNLKNGKSSLWEFKLLKGREKEYRYSDSSVGAIAACGLLILSKYVSEFDRELYFSAGKKILKNLYLKYGTFDDMDYEGLITHETGNFLQENNLDTALIYGDYFFTEGISLLRGGEEFW